MIVVGRLLNYMGARILGYGRRDSIDLAKYEHISQYFNRNQLPELLQNCDYIVSILPNTSETRGLLDGNILKNCKGRYYLKLFRYFKDVKYGVLDRGTVFVNVGRGSVISEESLVRALQEKWISGAILDVFDNEPLRQESLLWKMRNVSERCLKYFYLLDIFLGIYISTFIWS